MNILPGALMHRIESDESNCSQWFWITTSHIIALILRYEYDSAGSDGNYYYLGVDWKDDDMHFAVPLKVSRTCFMWECYLYLIDNMHMVEMK